jgi:pimeloyl-ACP methyl ester carboxylesterase/DNA-binding CsgD family transcriptional regulator
MMQAHGLLAGIRSAAMILSDRGVVVAANRSAHALFGLCPSAHIRTMPFREGDLLELADRVSAAAATGLDELVQIRRTESNRTVAVHLRPIAGPKSARQVLAVSSEHLWTDDVSRVLSRAFGLSNAELGVLRLLAAGETVGEVASRTGRRVGTVRSQLHALLAKTGTRTQAELMRIAALLLTSVPSFAEPIHSALTRPSARRNRVMHLSDGRRMDVVTYGHPTGRPLVWLQSTLGLHLLPVEAETNLAQRGIRVVVPIRAGYGESDPPPPDRDPFELAVVDTLDLVSRLRVDHITVVAPTDDIRIALMLAQADPARIEHIVGIGAGFPILTPAQYQRMHAVGRFFRACARHTPGTLPFIAKAFRAIMLRHGTEDFFRRTLRSIPGDERAFSNRDVADAVAAGFAYTFGTSATCEAAFCADLVRLHADWPPGLGDVRCPVTLIHGEQDGNAPFETALEYCAMYPRWRYIGFPDEGQLVAYARWAEVFDIIDGAFALPTA